ncbi:LapA family protein [Actinopolymorpha sp. B9G3]
MMARTHQEQEPRSFLARPEVRRIAGFAVLAVISLVFIFQNTAPTTVRLLVPEVTMPLWAALLIAWVLGLLASMFTLHRRR